MFLEPFISSTPYLNTVFQLIETSKEELLFEKPKIPEYSIFGIKILDDAPFLITKHGVYIYTGNRSEVL